MIKLNVHQDFTLLESNPPKSNFGEVESIKAVYNFRTDEIHFINTKKYKTHHEFVVANMGYKKDAKHFFYDQYGSDSIRNMHLITINYHKTINKYIFEFSAMDLVDCNGIYETFNKLKSNI